MEALMSFGIQGPKGDTGARGPTGATGPQGPAGTSGLSSIELFNAVYGNSPFTRSGVKYILWLRDGSVQYYMTRLQSRGQTLYWNFNQSTWGSTASTQTLTFRLSGSGYFSMDVNGSNVTFIGIALFFS